VGLPEFPGEVDELLRAQRLDHVDGGVELKPVRLDLGRHDRGVLEALRPDADDDLPGARALSSACRIWGVSGKSPSPVRSLPSSRVPAMKFIAVSR
jgi:hypothetical protein